MAVAARREAEQHTWDALFDHLLGWYAGLASAGEARSMVASGT
jgi:hypothetical protein